MSSSRFLLPLCFVFLIFLSTFISPIHSTAHDVCVCECCTATRCNEIINGTFPVDSCSKCLKEACEVREREFGCATKLYRATCYQRDSIFVQATIFLLVAACAALILLALFKEVLLLPCFKKIRRRFKWLKGS